MFQENKARQIFRKNEDFLPPDTYTYVCVQGLRRGKKCSFFGKFGVLCFLETPVLRFTLLYYYKRYIWWHLKATFCDHNHRYFHRYPFPLSEKIWGCIRKTRITVFTVEILSRHTRSRLVRGMWHLNIVWITFKVVLKATLIKYWLPRTLKACNFIIKICRQIVFLWNFRNF